jgi:hypothetical protein
MRPWPLVAVTLPLALSAPASAQVAPEDEARYREVVARVTSWTLTERRTYATLRELCRRAPRRLSGSPAAAAAVTWARQTMQAAGLEEVRLEPCTVPRWERGDVELLKLTAPPQAAGERLPILALGGSVPTPAGGVTAEVLQVQSLRELEERAAEVPGKIVFFNRAFQPRVNTFRAYGEAVDQRSRGPALAARLGALAAVVRSMTPDLDDVPHTGGMRNPTDADPIPAAAVSTLGAERIAALLREGPVRLHLRLSCRTLPDEPSFNVVGELKGREAPEEVVLLGAHLDSWDVGEGAHDCGAGCCQVIEALRLLKGLELRPRRTLRVVLFMNEENGLGGARAYADARAAAEEGGAHVLAIESDRGGFSPRGFTTNAGPGSRPSLEALVRLLQPLGADRLIPPRRPALLRPPPHRGRHLRQDRLAGARAGHRRHRLPGLHGRRPPRAPPAQPAPGAPLNRPARGDGLDAARRVGWAEAPKADRSWLSSQPWRRP